MSVLDTLMAECIFETTIIVMISIECICNCPKSMTQSWHNRRFGCAAETSFSKQGQNGLEKVDVAAT
jgi:hypothetical protein